MIVLWSSHDGTGDTAGRGVVSYMTAAEVLKPSADDRWERVVREPAPEVLAGDPQLMKAAISAVPFERRYASWVLSFERGDVDVAAFNRGDPTARATIAKLMEDFEAVAFAGIPEEHRPPILWTTHTHLGRLELNGAVPRAILAGDDKIKAINPHPPGAESRALWDAFQDKWNRAQGWADPNDPARARLAKAPDHEAKIAAEALRAGRQVGQSPRQAMAAWAEAQVRAGRINSRAELVAAIRAGGLKVPRQGADYLTLEDQEGRKIRLKGLVFSEAFTSREALAAYLAQPRNTDVAEAERRFAGLVAQRAAFNIDRYGGAGWTPPPAVDPNPHGPLRPMRPVAGTVRAAVLDSRQRAKGKIFAATFGAILPPELVAEIHAIDRRAQAVTLRDGSEIIDRGDRVTSSSSSLAAVRLALAEAAAKGWTAIEIEGTTAFREAAAAEAARLGLEVVDPAAAAKRLATLPPLSSPPQAAPSQEVNNVPDATGTRLVAAGAANGGRQLRASRAADAAASRFERAAGAAGRAAQRAGGGRTAMRSQAELAAEAEAFKALDMRQVAAALGFKEGKGSQNYPEFINDAGEKLVIYRGRSGDWMYSNNRAGTQGNNITLVKEMNRCSTAEACRWLREFNGAEIEFSRAAPKIKTPEEIAAAARQAEADWQAAHVTNRSKFLELERGISDKILENPRFAGTFRVDDRHNAVFPYQSAGRLVAVEQRNRPPKGKTKSFRHYTADAKTGVWCSQARDTDTNLVIVESPIKALAFAELYRAARTTRYLALRSGCDDADICAAIEAMPPGAKIVAAGDADDQGAKYNRRVREIAEAAGYEVREAQVPHGCKDWDQALRHEKANRQPAASRLAQPRQNHPEPDHRRIP